MKRFIYAAPRPMLIGALLAVAACAQLTATVVKFEQRAAPVIAKACDVFHQAEASPVVRIGLGIGGAANPLAGMTIEAVRSFGTQFCMVGPPPGDGTTPDQQAIWLADVTRRMIEAATKAAAAVK